MIDLIMAKKQQETTFNSDKIVYRVKF